MGGKGERGGGGKSTSVNEGRECFVKNDSVRSSLIELQSFLQSKINVDPIHSVLVFLPCFMHVFIVHDAVHSSRSYQTSRYQSRIDDGL